MVDAIDGKIPTLLPKAHAALSSSTFKRWSSIFFGGIVEFLGAQTGGCLDKHHQNKPAKMDIK